VNAPVVNDPMEVWKPGHPGADVSVAVTRYNVFAASVGILNECSTAVGSMIVNVIIGGPVGGCSDRLAIGPAT